MQSVIKFLFLFIFGAVSGWLIEVFYRSLKGKKLVNPGFLSGPYLPVYGFGIIVLYLLCSIDYSFIKNDFWQFIFMISIITVTLTFIELIAGLTFVYGFKIKLWDYSKLKFNFMGIIHPVFALAWSALGICYYFLINPWISGVLDFVSDNLIMILLIGFVYGVFFFDFGHSIGISARIRTAAVKLRIIIHYEKLKRTYQQKLLSQQQKTSFFNPFKLSAYSVKFQEAMTESVYEKFKKRIKIQDQKAENNKKNINSDKMT